MELKNNDTIIDVDFRETTDEAAQDTPETNAQVDQAQQPKTDEGIMSKVASTSKTIAKKIWKPVVGMTIAAGVVYFGYKMFKGTADNIPETIKDEEPEKLIEAVINVHGIAREEMTDEQMEVLHAAADQVSEILVDAENKIFGEETTEA